MNDTSEHTPPDDKATKQTKRRPGRRLSLLCLAGVLTAAAILIADRKWFTNAANSSSGRISVQVEIPNHANDPAASGDLDVCETKDRHGCDPESGDDLQTTDGTSDEHPIEPALRIAQQGLDHIHNNIADYRATIIKRERAKNGGLPDQQVMICKVRNRKADAAGNILVPFSVYLKFLEPRSIAGREVVWVENQNDGKLIAHEPGLKNLIRFKLDPDGFIAMLGQRYSLVNIGIEKLIEKLIRRGEEERQHGDIDNCFVQFVKDAKLDGRQCMMIEIRHPKQTSKVTCFIARIYFDEQLQLPLRYAAFLWPDSPDGELPVDEEYTYRDLRINVGLTDADFDPDNPEYDFP